MGIIWDLANCSEFMLFARREIYFKAAGKRVLLNTFTYYALIKQ